MGISSTSYTPGLSGNPRGRPKGSRNKASVAREQLVCESGLSPLDFMLRILEDENANLADRKWAAEKAAPFIHPRVASETFQSNSNEMSHEDWICLLEGEEKD